MNQLWPVGVAILALALGAGRAPTGGPSIEPVPRNIQALTGTSAAAARDPALQIGPTDRPLESVDGLVPHAVVLDAVTFGGRRAVHVVNQKPSSQNAVVEVSGTTIVDGTIEADVAGQPEAGASAGARGFIGLAFRVADDAHFDCFYIRPTNGRADDQLRRNHATQYISLPAFGPFRLRAESPGVYESYVDLVPGAWTHLRIDVAGQTAKLYVNGATQPTLIVNDLKRPAMSGLVGLWIGDETDGYFSRLTVRRIGLASPLSARAQIDESGGELRAKLTDALNAVAKGDCSVAALSPSVVDACGKQIATLQRTVQSLGTLKELRYYGTEQLRSGVQADVYGVVFDKGQSTWVVAAGPDGKLTVFFSRG